MLELKRAGLYIANGKNTSVLIKVAGEAPMLEIISGVVLNDMERDGTVTVLGKDDLIIQDILTNPKKYVFDYPAVSNDITGIPFGRSKEEMKDIEDIEFEKWLDKYQEFKALYPDNYKVKLQISLINEGFTINQADLIIAKLEKTYRVRMIS